MISVTLTVSKSGVYDEVAKTTSYTGAKMEVLQGGEGSYQRIFTTEHDILMLQRYWNEACAGATELLRDFLDSDPTGYISDPSTIEETTTDYVAECEMSSSYDESLTQGLESNLFSYFVDYMLSLWYSLSNKGEAESAMSRVVQWERQIRGKVYHRVLPKRVTIERPN